MRGARDRAAGLPSRDSVTPPRCARAAGPSLPRSLPSSPAQETRPSPSPLFSCLARRYLEQRARTRHVARHAGDAAAVQNAREVEARLRRRQGRGGCRVRRRASGDDDVPERARVVAGRSPGRARRPPDERSRALSVRSSLSRGSAVRRAVHSRFLSALSLVPPRGARHGSRGSLSCYGLRAASSRRAADCAVAPSCAPYRRPACGPRRTRAGRGARPRPYPRPARRSLGSTSCRG